VSTINDSATHRTGGNSSGSGSSTNSDGHRGAATPAVPHTIAPSAGRRGREAAAVVADRRPSSGGSGSGTNSDGHQTRTASVSTINDSATHRTGGNSSGSGSSTNSDGHRGAATPAVPHTIAPSAGRRGREAAAVVADRRPSSGGSGSGTNSDGHQTRTASVSTINDSATHRTGGNSSGSGSSTNSDGHRGAATPAVPHTIAPSAGRRGREAAAVVADMRPSEAPMQRRR
jgi:hypothetical protein